MASVNKVILVGNMGRDPETRYSPSGDAITNIALATTESWRDKNTGEKKEATEWHRVTFYRKLAEVVGQYTKKGSSLYVEGKLHTRKWTDKDGVERYTTEIIADSMQLLGGGPKQDDTPPQQQRQGSNKGASKQAPNFSDMDDDIPF